MRPSNLALFALALASCEVKVAEEASPVGVQRQAVAPGIVANGLAGDRLGASVAICGSEDMFSGGPGNSVFWADAFGGFPFLSPAGARVGGSVACLEGAQPRGFTVGDGGLYTLDNSVALRRLGSLVGLELVFQLDPPGNLVVIDSTGTLREVDPTTGQPLFQCSLPVGTRARAMVRANPPVMVDQQFLIGDPLNARIIRASKSILDGSWTCGPIAISGPAEFGRALTVGEFIPSGLSREVVVGARGQYFVYDLGSMQQRLNVDSGEPSFASALATRPNWVQTGLGAVDAVLVGAPGAERVYVFVGDAGVDTLEPFPLTAGASEFGAALAVFPSRAQVLVGAPGWNGDGGHGAVYVTDFNAAPVLDGSVQLCGLAGNLCPMCSTCLGGVVCISTCATGGGGGATGGGSGMGGGTTGGGGGATGGGATGGGSGMTGGGATGGGAATGGSGMTGGGATGGGGGGAPGGGTGGGVMVTGGGPGGGPSGGGSSRGGGSGTGGGPGTGGGNATGGGPNTGGGASTGGGATGGGSDVGGGAGTGGGATGGGATGGGATGGGATGGAGESPDGGPPTTTFEIPTCGGCSSAGAMPLLLFGTWLFARRRRR